jgi:aspartyl-tRNA(Asn)/glutamyl-tRNA(Gln) amidotransferase subunit C
MISKEEVKKIAKLARLAISEKETLKYQKELSLILDYIKEMEKADVSGVEPTSHPFSLENVMREDNPSKDVCLDLVSMAPDRKDNFVKVKSIFK